jgi:hypothetical protein
LGFAVVVRATHTLVWRSKYTPNQKTPSILIEGDKSDISEARLAFLKPYAYDLATRIRLGDEPLDVALEMALRAFFKLWMSRKGLEKARHSLSAISERDIKEDFASLYMMDARAFARDESSDASGVKSTNAFVATSVATSDVDERAYLEQSRNALALANSFNGGGDGAIPRRAA